MPLKWAGIPLCHKPTDRNRGAQGKRKVRSYRAWQGVLCWRTAHGFLGISQPELKKKKTRLITPPIHPQIWRPHQGIIAQHLLYDFNIVDHSGLLTFKNIHSFAWGLFQAQVHRNTLLLCHALQCSVMRGTRHRARRHSFIRQIFIEPLPCARHYLALRIQNKAIFLLNDCTYNYVSSLPSPRPSTVPDAPEYPELSTEPLWLTWAWGNSLLYWSTNQKGVAHV